MQSGLSAEGGAVRLMSLTRSPFNADKPSRERNVPKKEKHADRFKSLLNSTNAD